MLQRWSLIQFAAPDELAQELFLGTYLFLFDRSAIRLGRRFGWLDVALSFLWTDGDDFLSTLAADRSYFGSSLHS